MIAYLEGEIVFSEVSKAIVKTLNGVGYEVSLAKMRLPGEQVRLYTTQIFRENSQDVYAFETIEEKRFFEILIEVNGVGPKSAFSLVTSVGIESIKTAIILQDTTTLKKAPGIGKKAAEQIILSLKDKLDGLDGGISAVKKTKSMDTPNNQQQELFSQTLAACQELGFKDQQVLPVIKELTKQKNYQDPSELLKAVLQGL